MHLTLVSHKLCPYVQRAVIALNEKNAVYDRIDIDLTAKPDWFLALSPLGKTPILRVDNNVIFESGVICEYLEDTLKPALHPADPLVRAQHRAWMEFASAVLSLMWTLCTTKDDAVFQASQKTLQDRFSQLEKILGDGPYFSGAPFSLVDAAFGPVFRYFSVLGMVLDADPFEGAPKTKQWHDALMGRPSIQKAVSADYSKHLRESLINNGGILGQRLAAK